MANADVLLEFEGNGYWSGHRGQPINITHVDCRFFLNNDHHDPHPDNPDEVIYWNNITPANIGQIILADTTSFGFNSVAEYLTNGKDNNLWAFVKSSPEG